MKVPDDIDIRCKFKQKGIGSFICSAAVHTGGTSTKMVWPEQCLVCEIGRVYRELGCEYISGIVGLIKVDTFRIVKSHMFEQHLFCDIRERETTFEYCENCKYITGEFTKPIVKEVISYYDRLGFSSARYELIDSIEYLNKGKYGDAISSATSSVESTIKTIIDLSEDMEMPATQTLKKLWSAVSVKLHYGDESLDEIMNCTRNSLSSLEAGFSIVRKSSKAHGRLPNEKKPTASVAQLTINLCASFSLFLIQRFFEGEK